MYVIWKGRETGVFNQWSEVEPLVKGFKGAAFKRYDNPMDAVKAFHEGPEGNSKTFVLEKIKSNAKEEVTFLQDSFYCQANFDDDQGVLQVLMLDNNTHEVIEVTTKTVKFYEYNLIQFIAIIECLAFLVKNGYEYSAIYNNSPTACYWATIKQVGGVYKNMTGMDKEVDLGETILKVFDENNLLTEFKRTPAVLKSLATL